MKKIPIILIIVLALISSANATTLFLTGSTSFSRSFQNLRSGSRQATVPWSLTFAGIDSSLWRITGVRGILETTTTWSGTTVVLGNAPASVVNTAQSTSLLQIGATSLNTNAGTPFRSWDLPAFGGRSWSDTRVNNSGTVIIPSVEWSRFYDTVSLSGTSNLTVTHTHLSGMFVTQSSQTLALQQLGTFEVEVEAVVPEPATLAALGMGMVVLANRRRRRRG